MPLTTPQNPSTLDTQDNTERNKQLRKQRGTGFVNIGQILQANQGAGQKMGASIGSGLSTLGQQANDARTAGTTGFNTGFQAGYNPANTAIETAEKNVGQQPGESDEIYRKRIAEGKQYNTPIPGRADAITTNATQPGTSTGPVAQDGTTTGAVPQINFSQVGQAVKGAQYTGPQGIENAGQIQAKGAAASALGRLAGNTGGQQQLLRNMVAERGHYSTGQNALDSLLLGKEGQGAIQQGRSGLHGLDTKAQGAVVGAQTQAQNAVQGIDTRRTGLFNGIKDVIGGINTQATTRAVDFAKDANRARELLSKGVALDPESPTYQKDYEIISNLDKYGLKDESLYGGDQEQLRNTIMNMGTAINPNEGGTYYQGDEQNAAANLAAFREGGGVGDVGGADKIRNSTYDTNVYKGDAATIQAQATAKAANDAQLAKVSRLASLLDSPQAKYLSGNHDAQWKKNILAEAVAIDPRYSKYAHDINSLSPVIIRQMLSDFAKRDLSDLTTKSKQQGGAFDAIKALLNPPLPNGGGNSGGGHQIKRPPPGVK